MRTNKTIIVVGNRGVGKTSWIKSVLDDFPQQKKLIVDTFDNPVWRTMETHDKPQWADRVIRPIELTDLYRHDFGFRRVFSDDTDFLQSMIAKGPNNKIGPTKNTAVVFEDVQRYFSLVLSRDQRAYILNSKQTNCDFIFVFHTLAMVAPELLRLADVLVLFKTGDVVFPKKLNYPGVYEAFVNIKKSRNKYDFKIIELS
jgi:hypothetical protein